MEMTRSSRSQSTIIMHIIALIAIFSFVAQAALAVSTGVSPLDQGIILVSDIFNIRAFDNSLVQEGFLKLMLFIVTFAVAFRALRIPQKGVFSGDQGRRTAGIVSFAFSMIGIFMMPTSWLMVTGGTITAIMSSFIFILVFWGGAYIAVRVLSSSEEDDRAGWVKNLMGFLLILLLIMLLDVWVRYTGLPGGVLIP